MKFALFSISLFSILICQSMAVRCKCTKESETVFCNDGVCETDVGSCLMLDHPTMGVHYTCHTRGLKDGSCHNRTSKSGVSVRICGCNAPDFCNYSMWPDKSHHSHHKHHHTKHHKNENSQDDSASSASASTSASSSSSSPFLLILPSICLIFSKFL